MRHRGSLWITLGVLIVAAAAATTLEVTISSTLRHHDGMLRPPVPTRSVPAGDPAVEPTVEPTSSPPPVHTVSPSPSRTTGPDERSQPSARVRDVLVKFRFAIRQGFEADEIRGDVARDLDNVAANSLDDDGEEQLRRDVVGLKEKVRTRWREGAITRHRAAEFMVILDQAGFS
ncbi:hypothetical protein J4573_27715 [Actinomadura barringtoniae]|uniref:Uncharacterized protein n=1 Tax=Actinomadura barringtoniae TaxID=1427535 RepID=A0A939PEN9_9ACTN|nr:hypothetical protein [Actinomadura barringtoniae]MBO2450913.1 hypothetical protein [Actinomadura barringtoniae]